MFFTLNGFGGSFYCCFWCYVSGCVSYCAFVDYCGVLSYGAHCFTHTVIIPAFNFKVLCMACLVVTECMPYSTILVVGAIVYSCAGASGWCIAYTSVMDCWCPVGVCNGFVV